MGGIEDEDTEGEHDFSPNQGAEIWYVDDNAEIKRGNMLRVDGGEDNVISLRATSRSATKSQGGRRHLIYNKGTFLDRKKIQRKKKVYKPNETSC